MVEGDSTTIDRRTFLQSTGAAGGAVALANVASADPDPREDSCTTCRASPADRRLIVGVSDTVSPADVEPDLPAGTNVRKRNDTLGFMVVDLPENTGTYGRLSVQSEIATHEKVKYTERDAMFYPTAVSVGEASTEADVSMAADDPLFSDQYAPQQVRADVAWERTEGSKDVMVAIVDQGVAYDHPDLTDQFGENKGKDFVDDTDDPAPANPNKEYHGTHVAGIAAASTNNGKGVAGVSDSTLLSCRALGLRGGRISDIADAIKYATDQGADVINLSLGGGGRTETGKQAVSYAVNNGALPVAAAGNDCADQVGYPARYDECVAVSAIDKNEQLADFSNYGSNVDITGPGVDVVSCWPTVPKEDPYGGKYNAISGTSMSCPAVSGVVALGAAANPDLGPDGLRRKLKSTAVDVGLPSNKQGAGRADAVGIIGGLGDDDGSNTGPTASFSVNPNDPHVGENVVCRAVDSGDGDGYVDSWEWSFGDGTTMTGEQAIHSYSEPGSYSVTLTVTDDDGATASTMRSVRVQEGGCGELTQTKEFSGTVKSGDTRKTHGYSFSTDEPCKLVLSIEENVDGDGDFILYAFQRSADVLKTECEGQVVMRPRTIRKLNTDESITVGVYSGDGSSSPTGDYTVTVEEAGFGADAGNESPTAAFEPEDPSVSPGEAIEFDAAPAEDPDGSIESYEWELGDGNTASGETVVHSYGETGDYTVALTVTDDAGASASTEKTVTVANDNAAPAAEFEVNSSTLSPGESLEVDAGPSEDSDGDIVAYEWTFGDGGVASGETASNTYDETGDYEVELQVTDDDGATGTATQTITVEKDGGGECGATVTTTETGSLSGRGDNTDYSYAVETKEPCSVTVTLTGDEGPDFDLYLTTDGRTPTPYDYDRRSWNYGIDEEIVVEEEVSPDSEFGILVHAYSGTGDYELTIEESGVGGSGGGGGNSAPTATAEIDSPAPAGTEVEFDASPSEDPDGELTSFQWDFGDGRTAGGETVTHSYEEAGEYTVTLTVTDDDGATATDETDVTIRKDGRNKPPRAKFSVSDDSVSVGTEVSFDASDTRDDGSIESYEWSFGDGKESTGELVEHTYEEAGEFTVTLTVTDDHGASDEATTAVTVSKGGGGGGGGDACGDERNRSIAEDSLSSGLESQEFSYTAELENPCQVTLTLSGPHGADFDLYATEDGRTPSTFDYDKKSTTQDSQEQIIFEEVETSQTFGILVDSWDGSGAFALQVLEHGKK